MLTLELPYPPGVNHYLGRKVSRSFLTEKTRQYRREVWLAVKQAKWRTLVGPVSVAIDLIPGKGKIPDIDGGLKVLLDAMQHAGVFVDDQQVEYLDVRRMAKDPKHPRCTVWVEKL